jgi:hypothetical protein
VHKRLTTIGQIKFQCKFTIEIEDNKYRKQLSFCTNKHFFLQSKIRIYLVIYLKYTDAGARFVIVMTIESYIKRKGPVGM